MENLIKKSINQIDSLISDEIVEKIYKKAKLSSKIENNIAYIEGNNEGIYWLILFLVDLIKDDKNNHLHLDQFNGLEKESIELIFEKINSM